MKALILRERDGIKECKLKAFGEMIANCREVNGISQRGLARKCGISNSTISRIEKGLEDEVGVMVIYKICKTLHLNFFEVFGALYPKIYEEYKDAFELFRNFENNMNAKQKKAVSEMVQIFNELFE